MHLRPFVPNADAKASGVRSLDESKTQTYKMDEDSSTTDCGGGIEPSRHDDASALFTSSGNDKASRVVEQMLTSRVARLAAARQSPVRACELAAGLLTTSLMMNLVVVAALRSGGNHHSLALLRSDDGTGRRILAC
ncbi:hypothetical protein PPROV_001106100 [Pycnococcus provasolii]|uniref:Uncharacterized protein n=1 Tax=Pycnococcus provasolii TaxID=41880 RepID=A0A830HZW7_9CHLO|nr:hypothetical protein PPROV_001106100 [Pycnococcus provasolii]